MTDIKKAIKRLESCSIIPFDEDSQEVCGLAIEALKKQISKNEWINVKDKLPSEKGYYLVAIPHKWRGISEWNIITLYFRGKTKWATCNGDITHWMPLPKPPEK